MCLKYTWFSHSWNKTQASVRKAREGVGSGGGIGVGNGGGSGGRGVRGSGEGGMGGVKEGGQGSTRDLNCPLGSVKHGK